MPRLISMLIPSTLSASSQRKYFEKVCEDDLNPLLQRGIDCPRLRYRVKVKVFGQTLDLKGREKFLDQMSVNGYMGCSHCRVNFPVGVNGSGPRYGVARTHLPPDHVLRQRANLPYEYPGPELGGATITMFAFMLCFTIWYKLHTYRTCISQRHCFRSHGGQSRVGRRIDTFRRPVVLGLGFSISFISNRVRCGPICARRGGHSYFSIF